MLTSPIFLWAIRARRPDWFGLGAWLSIAVILIPNLTHPLSIGMILFVVSTVVSQPGAVNPATGWIWIDFMFRLVLTCLMVVTLSMVTFLHNVGCSCQNCAPTSITP